MITINTNVTIMTSPLDLDTVKYPRAEPHRLVLSVSDLPIELAAGLDAPIDFYVENFKVTQDLATQNKNNNHPIRFGLFTNTFVAVPSDPNGRLNLNLSGADGNASKPSKRTAGQIERQEDEDGPNGWKGGTLDFYAENVDKSTIDTIRFNGKSINLLSARGEQS